MGSSHSSLVNLAYLYHSYVSVTWVRARAFLVCSLCIPRDQGSAWWREKPSDYLGNERTACGVSGPFKDEKVGRQQGLHSGKASEPLLPVGWLRKALGLGDGRGWEGEGAPAPCTSCQALGTSRPPSGHILCARYSSLLPSHCICLPRVETSRR